VNVSVPAPDVPSWSAVTAAPGGLPVAVIAAVGIVAAVGVGVA
jgi:hypothetical protein